MWHEGMDSVLSEHMTIPRPGKKVTLLVGEPIDMEGFLATHRDAGSPDVLVRKDVTDHLSNILLNLSEEARHLHAQRLGVAQLRRDT